MKQKLILCLSLLVANKLFNPENTRVHRSCSSLLLLTAEERADADQCWLFIKQLRGANAPHCRRVAGAGRADFIMEEHPHKLGAAVYG